MIEAFKDAMKNYATFTGVASRKQYWYFVLANVCIGFVIGFLGAITAPEAVSVITLIFQIAMVLPSMAIAVRRMHDSDHSGWWVIVPIANFIMLFFPTKTNRYAVAN